MLYPAELRDLTHSLLGSSVASATWDFPQSCPAWAKAQIRELPPRVDTLNIISKQCRGGELERCRAEEAATRKPASDTPLDCRHARAGQRRSRTALPSRSSAGIDGYWCAQMGSQWRMGRDSNPRCRCRHAGFQDRCLKPLGHPSGSAKSSNYELGHRASSVELGPDWDRTLASSAERACRQDVPPHRQHPAACREGRERIDHADWHLYGRSSRR